MQGHSVNSRVTFDVDMYQQTLGLVVFNSRALAESPDVFYLRKLYITGVQKASSPTQKNLLLLSNST